jgi:predicted  nucleic acid-binding Zn-ribbon protein
MEMFNILTAIGGIMLAVIGYFLKSTMEELKSVKELSYKTQSELSILKNDHINKYDNMTEKFDELKAAVIDLTKEIKELNKRVK